MVRAATDEAKASNEVVQEMRRDRDLSWCPIMSVRWPSHAPGSVGSGVGIELTNSGSGPAITCRYVGTSSGQDPIEAMSPAVDVAPGHTVATVISQQIDRNESMRLSKWIDDRGLGHTVDTMGAIFAKDVFGNRYRFVVVKDSRQQALIEHVDRWSPGEGHPDWMSRDVWPDYGVAGEGARDNA